MSAGSPGTAGPAGSDPDASWSPPAPEPEAGPVGADLREQCVVCLRVTAALVLVGALVGLVWRLVAPVAQVRIDAQGGSFVDPEPKQYVAADVVFAGLSLLAGVVVGIVVWRLVRRSQTAAVLGLAIGGLAGAFMAREIGQLLGHTDGAAAARLPVGSIVSVSLQLVAGAGLLVLPVAAVAAWLVADLVGDWRAARASGSAAGSLPVAGPAVSPGLPAGLSQQDQSGPPPTSL